MLKTREFSGLGVLPALVSLHTWVLVEVLAVLFDQSSGGVKVSKLEDLMCASGKRHGGSEVWNPG